jgi:PAS domain S-box-containing protein
MGERNAASKSGGSVPLGRDRRRRQTDQHTFLLDLADALVPATDAHEAESIACRRLGQALQVARVGYAEDAGDGETIRVTCNYCDGVPGLEGDYRYDDYGSDVLHALLAGRTVVRSDIPHDGSLTAAEKAAHAALSLGATVNVPIVKDRRLAAVLFVHSRDARAWTGDDVRLIEAVAERTWDAVQRTRADTRLPARESELERVLELTPFMITRCSRDLTYRFVSKAYAAMLGRTPQQIAGRRIADVLGEKGYAMIQPHVERVLAGETVHFEAAVPFRTAGLRNLSVTYTPERDHAGAVAGWIASMHDVTEQQRPDAEIGRLNDQLSDASRRKDEFLAILAHELRNPLGPIRTGLELLRVTSDPTATLQQVRPIMERQVAHMVRLVDDLLDISRIVSGRIELRKAPSRLHDLVGAAIDENRATFDRSSLLLQIDLPADGCVLDVDPTRFVQVLSNVLHNAAKYTPAGGIVTIKGVLEETGNGTMLALTVRDTGVGIAVSKLASVFDLFEQSDPADLQKGGLGIGLALARRLIELHNGSITAESEGPGRGSAFTIRLPLPVDQPVVRSANGQTIAHISRRVLVIDDNRDAADALALLVHALGGDAQTADSGAEGLERARQFQPDIVFIDIGMPGMDGYETCRHLREQASVHRPFLAALTGWGQDRDRRRAMEAGFDLHLTKPADPQVLQALLAGANR